MSVTCDPERTPSEKLTGLGLRCGCLFVATNTVAVAVARPARKQLVLRRHRTTKYLIPS